MPIDVIEIQTPGPQGADGIDGSPTEFDLRGTVSPEGVVTANPGVYYTDSNGTNGAWRWLKKTGTGNTGWVVTSGDTGWRNINSLINATFLPSGVLSGSLLVRRTETGIYLGFSGLRPNADTALGTYSLVTLPTGFAPIGGMTGLVNKSNGLAVTYQITSSGPSVYLIAKVFPAGGSWLNADPLVGVIPYIGTSTHAWPTSLPGTAA